MRLAAALAASFGLAFIGPQDASAAQGDDRAVFPEQHFTPTPAGSYTLPPILTAPRGRVLDEAGKPRTLGGYLSGRITLLSFVYTHCTDPAGCPLAFSTLSAVRDRLSKLPEATRAQMVSLSFDPQYDTPDVMRMFSKSFDGNGKRPAWHFLTTASARDLEPLLAGFGQDTAETAPGEPRRLDHTLRVFLIDGRGRVREIYSSAFLMPEVIVNDILTLAAESPR